MILEYIPAIEFLVNIDSACVRQARKEILDINGGINPWRKRVESGVSPFELSDLDHLFTPVSTSVFLFYFVILDNNREAEDLISALQSISPETFINNFRDFLKIDGSEKDWISTERIEDALFRDRARESVSFREEAEMLTALLSSGDSYRRKLIEVLTWYNNRFFKNDKLKTRTKIESWIADHRKNFDKDIKHCLDLLTGDSYDSLLSTADEIRIFPVSDSANSRIWLMLPGEAYIVFSASWADEILSKSDSVLNREKLTDMAVEALSDPKRFAMLRLMKRRPWYGRELADELGITPSTASYHIEKLVAARLIRLELSKGRRFYYSINHEGFREMLKLLDDEFLKDSV